MTELFTQRRDGKSVLALDVRRFCSGERARLATFFDELADRRSLSLLPRISSAFPEPLTDAGLIRRCYNCTAAAAACAVHEETDRERHLDSDASLPYVGSDAAVKDQCAPWVVRTVASHTATPSGLTVQLQAGIWNQIILRASNLRLRMHPTAGGLKVRYRSTLRN